MSEALAPLSIDPASTALLFDIDGTLAPIVDHAEDATVPESTRQLLIKLARRYGVVACVSGRRASGARAMVSIGSITYLGSHGAELLRAGWTEAALDPALGEWAERIGRFARDEDMAELRRHRIRIEDKGAIAAFHWRTSADQQTALSQVQAIAQRAEAAGLHTHWGRKVLEVRAPAQFDKGVGIAKLLREERVKCALYAGDDVTDLDAFRMLRQLQAEGELDSVVLVGVEAEDGPEEIREQADLLVAGTEGIRDVLAMLAG